MSYDLMVFEPTALPHRHDEFIKWHESEAGRAEAHDSNDRSVATVRLQTWFIAIIRLFPPMNGPLSKEELPEEEASTADYTIGRNSIYCLFAWSKVEQAYSAVFELAEKHGLGFFNVSSGEEEVWLPKNGKLSLAHSK